MFRRFEFEKDVYETLELVPMSVRRKLDLLGLKLHLKQWQSLSRPERLIVCHFPITSQEEAEVLIAFLREAVARRDGSDLRELGPVTSDDQSQPASIPPDAAKLLDQLKLPKQGWLRLDADEQYALARLAHRGPEKFLAAWREFESI
jgi:hypothetical protein